MNWAATEDARLTPTAASLLVQSAAGPMVEALRRGLLAAGFPVTIVSSVFDAVVEAARAADPIRHFVVGVDLFGEQEFRLFPLVRREWPGALIVAYHSAGFEHKGRLAEVIGADVVLGTFEAVAQFVESLAPSVAATTPHPIPLPQKDGGEGVSASSAAQTPSAEPVIEPMPPEAAALLAQAPAEKPAVAAGSPKSGAEALKALAAVVTESAPTGQYVAAAGPAAASSQGPQASQPPADTLADGEVVGTVELTEEELRLLLGEEEGA